MTDYNPKPGYTRTGKTIKQVKRYYAMKDAARRKGRSPRVPSGRDRSPASPNSPKSPKSINSPNSPQDDERTGEHLDPMSRRKKLVIADGLAKRIANELTAQKEAIEMQRRRHPDVAQSTVPQIYIQPEGTNPSRPIFVTESAPKSPSRASDKRSMSPALAKALNELESVNLGCAPTEKFAVSGAVENYNYPIGENRTDARRLGITFACFAIGLVYIITWLFLVILEVKYTNTTGIRFPEDGGLRTKNFNWLTFGSIPTLIGIPYWWLQPRTMFHMIASMIIIVLSTLNIFAAVIYRLIVGIPPPAIPKPLHHKLWEDDSLNYWMPSIFLILHCLTIYAMASSFGGLLAKQIVEKTKKNKSPKQETVQEFQNSTVMSHFMSPISATQVV